MWKLKESSTDMALVTPGYEVEFQKLPRMTMAGIADFFSVKHEGFMIKRLKLFSYLKNFAVAVIQEEIDDLTPKLLKLNAQVVQQRNAMDIEICRTKKIIGLTTTAAARLAPMLEELGSKIILCEEASEVLESHTIASLTRSCQHMIMIGDHQQLRPKPSNNDLASSWVTLV